MVTNIPKKNGVNDVVCKINKDGSRFWYNENGHRHRLNGPAVVYLDGTITWWQDDRLHREDGPALEYPNGIKEWFQNGKRHRLDGPAIEWAYGDNEYWVYGKYYSKREWKKYYGL